jgi:hypothetical protein
MGRLEENGRLDEEDLIVRAGMLLLLAVVGLVGAPTASAVVVFEHTGATDPTTEGWSALAVPNPPFTDWGPIFNDGGSGFDAWFIDDDASFGGSFLAASAVPSAAHNAIAIADGWTLRARLRVPDASEQGNSSTTVLYSDGADEYLMMFGSDADSDPLVRLYTGGPGGAPEGPTFTLEGAGNGYHLYELIFDPVAGSADLWVDGIERISDYAGVVQPSTRVVWGSAGSITEGRVHYNLVQWEIPNQPPSLPSLSGLGIAMLLGLMTLAGVRKITDRTAPNG